ncbi:peptide/nickel transport system ATP-binding protein [Desulfatibacillum alkenivorans DSM 16219]|jgi:peptide/nickel transport system ATP-binding protein|uniref:Peptide/nickel transport system ATP-binding protein n=1 Tax=Desulfatibacillum alkenivorans DSM 16219 TaxID=1121393 RepID=A0A1M6WW36_9BACT|nr:oligopeptide/dipeptide ABC transporter ATP-binding protein [Desulfatibacillum alkenivorans]SHK97779.1 peptide/nickel transport system ATP-binding protein [Desulfatibacillum alkenivorans DSM 16219]
MNTQAKPLLKLEDVYKEFDVTGGFWEQFRWENGRPVRKKAIVKAVNGVTFDIYQGETFSVVGESGCGKSTLARTVTGLLQPECGKIFYDGDRIDDLSYSQKTPYKKRMQMVFQDPYASLNPRFTVRKTLEEPLFFHYPELTREQRLDRIAEVMEQVGVHPAWAERFPHEFSGGQRQRISIARALMVDPEFIVADEPVSALDVSVQAQILNLFMEAQEKRGLTYMFITHDLSVVAHISTRVAVMYLGSLCELSPGGEIFNNPRHPYTKALLSAIPRLGEKKAKHIRLKGEVTSPLHLPSGCVFHKRCTYAKEICTQEIPTPFTAGDNAAVACHGVEQGWVG